MSQARGSSVCGFYAVLALCALACTAPGAGGSDATADTVGSDASTDGPVLDALQNTTDAPEERPEAASADATGTQTDGAIVPSSGPMQLISANVPAYASSGAASAPMANDNMTSQGCCGSEASNWSSTTLPAWLAYDLSATPANMRTSLVIAWYTFASATLNSAPNAMNVPLTYVLEGNTAPGGASAAPTDGWQTLTLHDNPPRAADGSITSAYGNFGVGANVHWVDFASYNWIRIRVLTVQAGTNVSLDMDVYDAPNGPTDSWIFMGDSVTHVALTRGEDEQNTIPLEVEAMRPDHFPAYIEYGVGGTQASAAPSELPTVLQWFIGKYVTLNFGTNQSGTPQEFLSAMESAVQMVIAGGHIPVIPTIPYPNTNACQNMAVEAENATLPMLFQDYPQALPGPDLWTLFMQHPEYTMGSAPHPNDAGKAAYVQAWADWIAQSVDTQ